LESDKFGGENVGQDEGDLSFPDTAFSLPKYGLGKMVGKINDSCQ
jgi:hypothetical protein